MTLFRDGIVLGFTPLPAPGFYEDPFGLDAQCIADGIGIALDDSIVIVVGAMATVFGNM